MSKSKHTKMALLASVVSLLTCCALLVGTTFAWFTDSVVNTGNRIQSGQLDVRFNGSRLVDSQWETEHHLDRKALFNEENWEPGQYGAVVINVSNYHSNLAAKVDVKFNITDGENSLANALWYRLTPFVSASLVPDRGSENVNDKLLDRTVPVKTGDSRVKPMTEIESDSHDPLTLLAGEITGGSGNIYGHFLLEYGMYTDAANQYMNGTFGLDFTVNATQAPVEKDGFGNSNYDADADWPPVSISNADQLKQALADAQPGDVLSLQAGIYALEESLVIPSGVSLMGAQAGTPASQWADADASQKTIIKAPNTGDRVLQILQNDAASPVSNVVLDGIEIDGEGKYVKGIYVKKEAGAAMQGIVIRNCAVVNTDNDGIDVSNTDGAVIENNYVSHVADNGIRLGNYKNTDGNTAYVRNNVIDTVSATQNGAIMVTSGAGDVVVSGNVISNVAAYEGSNGSSEVKRSAIHVYDVFEGGTVIIENNRIADVDQGIAVYKFSSLADEDKVVVRGNTVTDYKTFAIATSTLNNEKLDVTTLVEITGNDFSTAEPAADGLYIEETNHNWQVIASENTAGNGTYIAD